MIAIVLLLFIVADVYLFQGIRSVVQNSSGLYRKIVFGLYWGFSALIIGSFLWYQLGNGSDWPRSLKTFMLGAQIVNFFTKFFFLVFVLMDDLIRAGKWVLTKITFLTTETQVYQGEGIPRSEFLLKAGVIMAAVPLISVSYGIISGAHDYQVRKVKIPLKNLPSSFHGIRIAQISDIHSGSFFRKKAVLGGVEMLLKEKPDLVFFTGDLVNNTADEVQEYIDIFSKVKAPLGVYSTLGNHDYGEYVRWSSSREKAANLENLKKAHEIMGWKLLNNENHLLEQSGEKLAILGIENWGAGSRWPKYGKMDLAVKGTEESAVKLLLSHDPSHWDAQVRTQYPDIDVMFSGHTHGFQFGVEIGDFKWSPVQYMYKQWAGLYSEKDQHLYVNRGYGFLGFPGRVGMPPEITIVELEKA